MKTRANGTPLLVVVGAGGVGKTTLAAALGIASAEAGARTLVMTFDPSLRLKDALGDRDPAPPAEAVPDSPAARERQEKLASLGYL